MATFRNDSDLIKAIKKDKRLLQQIKQNAIKNGINLQKSKKSLGYAKDVAELETYAKELNHMIISQFKSLPEFKKIFVDNMFDGITTESQNLIRMKFSDSMIKENKFKTHLSFIPILWEYGWSVKGAKYSREHFMAFSYYAGSHAISDAISKFNKKHEKDGIYAMFTLGDTDIQLITEKLPYKI